MKKISIIIPAYNEEKRIGKTLKEYCEYFKKLKNKKIIDFEICVVINNTKDNTEEIVKTYMKKYSELRYLNFKKGGKGFAIIEGFKSALNYNNDLIGFVDADNATSANAFYDLVKHINRFEGIIASRYIPGAIVKPKQNLQRRVVSRVFNFMIRSLFLFNYRDTQCGAKLFTKKAIQIILQDLTMTQWAFDIDLLYILNKNKQKVIEYPTIWRDTESSKLNIKKTSIQMFLAMIQLRILKSPLKRSWKFFSPIAGGIWGLVK